MCTWQTFLIPKNKAYTMLKSTIKLQKTLCIEVLFTALMDETHVG